MNLLRIFLYLFTFLATPYQSISQSAVWMEGSVFLDKNQNGKPDKGEHGLKKIAISNGKDIVYTSNEGRYRIQVYQGQSLFPICPTGFTISENPVGNIKNAQFYYLFERPMIGDRCDFGLVRAHQSSSFRVGAIGDIQVGNTEELNYAGKSIIRELSSRSDLAFNLILGDLVNDNVELFTPFKQMLKSLPTSNWTVLGNHDRDIEPIEKLDQSFKQAFGASTYAFNYGGVHFIVLNNVFATGTRSYEGRISEDQMQFLVNDLKTLKSNSQIVLCQHIPMAYTRNRKEVLRLLEGFSNVLILSGHTHQVSRHFYNQGTIQEIVTGAPSGNWWTGETNAQGIPDALMQCGSPRNYFTIDFNRSTYSFQFKGIGLDTDQQQELSWLGDTLITNIYAGSDSTIVRVKIDQQNWITMKQIKRPAESVLRLVELNKSKKLPAAGKRINPLRKRASPHIWQAVVPKLSPGSHNVHIHAYDRFGYKVETVETIYIAPKPD